MSGEMIEAEIERLTKDRNDWRAEATRLTNASTGLITILNAAQADVERLAAERDAALADLDQVRYERGTALESFQNLRADIIPGLTKERDAALAEVEGLRADLLRITAERDNWRMEALGIQLVSTPVEDQLREAQERYAYLQAKCTELQRGTESDHQIILGLRECLERSDKRLLQAKARQIPPALVGLLGVIRREAAAAEKMIL